MRAVRLFCAIVMATGVTWLAAPTATAGGGLWDLDGQPSGQAFYEPGSIMTATGIIYLPGGVGRNDRGAYWAGPEHGPFSFYISRRNGPQWGPYAPPLPKDAQYMGEVTLEQRDKTTWDASGTFTLPELEPGHYTLHHCNDPCTRQLGDMMSTPFTVIEDRSQVPLWLRLDNLRDRAKEIREELDTTETGLQTLDDRVDIRLDALQEEQEAFGTRLQAVETEVKRLRSQQGTGLVEGSLAFGAAAALAGLFVLSLRRRQISA